MVRLFRRRLAWEHVEETNIETNFAQAAQALELAASEAARRGDPDKLVNAAHGWMRMVETFSSMPPHMFSLESSPPEHQPGFRGSTPSIEEETGEE